MAKPLIIKPSQMQIGDVVNRVDNTLPYGTCTVKQIKDGMIHFFRPYVHTSRFICTSGTICYLGFEEFTIYSNDTDEFYLWERRYLK